MTHTNSHTRRRLITSVVCAAVLLLCALMAAQADAHVLRPRAASARRRGAGTGRCLHPRKRATHRECGKSARLRRHSSRRHKSASVKTPARNSQTATPAARTAPAPRPTVGACTQTELIPSSSNIEQVRQATLCLINQQREQHGELALVENGKLDSAAQGHSENMVERDYFEHTSPTGEEFQTRIMASGYVPRGAAYELGENIDTATLSLATPAATVTAWMNSPEHRANILNGEFRETGMGIAAAAPEYFAEGEPGATYTQDFGVLATSSE